jgi:hypothetical protein
MGFLCASQQTAITYLIDINKLILVMVKRCVLSEVRIKLLNEI